MSIDNSFGEMFIASKIETAAKPLIIAWYDAYIQEAARVLDLPTDYFPSIEKGEVLTLSEFEQEGRTYRSPTVILASPGMDGVPKHKGDGTYIGKWLLGVGVVATVPFSHDRGGDTAKAMAGALRSLMLQHKSLGLSEVHGMTWLGETYDDRQLPDDETMSEAFVRFSIDVVGIVDTLTIPNRDDTPPDDPTVDPGPYETADEVNVTAEPNDTY